MKRGADSRVGQSVKKRPHLLNDLARAKGRRLIRAYEKNPYPKSNSPYPAFPAKKALHAADLLATGGAGQMIADKLHGKNLSGEQKIALGALAGGGGAAKRFREEQPILAPRSIGDSADPYVRALNRLSASSPNNVAKLLIEANSPIRRLLDAKLGAKPIHSTGALMDTHGGFPRRRYTESHVLKGNQSHLPFIPGDPNYGAQRFRPLSPERRAALNRVLFEHLYQTRN